MDPIQQAASKLIAKHKGLRAAARATGLDHAYLFRLSRGCKKNPSDEVLAILGLERKPVSYVRRRNGGK